MHDAIIGPFAITFTHDAVEFRTERHEDPTKLTYSECYELFRTLYVRRDAIYKYTHREKPIDPPKSDGKATYTENQESFSIASWDTETELS